jgi:hypothetical protein
MEAPPFFFVISTEAKRSGEISVLTPFLDVFFDRAERSAVFLTVLGDFEAQTITARSFCCGP